MKPVIIIVEGLDHSGKTEITQGLVERLELDGLKVMVAREPGGTPEGEATRAYLKEHGEHLSAHQQFWLFTSARTALMEHISEIKHRYDVIIFDRSWYTSLVYQGQMGLKEQYIIETTKAIDNLVEPNAVLIIDRETEEAFTAGDSMEACIEKLGLREAMRQRYIKLSNEVKSAVLIKNIDGHLDDSVERAFDVVSAVHTAHIITNGVNP